MDSTLIVSLVALASLLNGEWILYITEKTFIPWQMY